MSIFRLNRLLCHGNVLVLIIDLKFQIYGFDFALVELVAPLCLQWPMPQLLPVSWASKTGQCSVYYSLMSMAKRDKYFSILHIS